MADFDIEKFPTSESAKNMMESISKDFYQNSYVMKWLQQVMGMEWDDAKRIIEEELPLQFFPETATWGLMFHEIKYQLPVRENLSYEERRKRIYKKRDFKAPMIPYKMEEYLQKATGAEVHVMDCHDPGEFVFVPDHPNRFKVIFIKEGTLDSKVAIQEVDKIKQSHTVYIIEDMVLIAIDQSDLEDLRLYDLHFKIRIMFWEYTRILDGSKLLDGTNIMEGLHNGVLDVEILNSGWFVTHGIDVDSLYHIVSAYVLNNSSVRMGDMYQDFLVNFVKPDLEAAVGYVASMHTSLEDDIVLTIETYTKDYELLNGSKILDGSKALNSIYRKETE